ncbi:MAG: hypothetical protein JJE39_03190 [Vicinamibacteria bacterium]|nr:hypothetical protein [Vicinamibacteria bacterium]
MALEHTLTRRRLMGFAAIPATALALLGGGALRPLTAQAQAQAQAPLEVARLGFLEGGVEIQRSGGGWIRVAEGDALSIGDRVRTLRGGTARLEFPWTAIAMGDESEISVQKNRVLTLQLEKGRLDIDPEQSLLRVVTEEAAISGSGRTLVRREPGATFVGSYAGGADVEGNGTTVRLGLNKGTLVRKGAAPTEAMLMSAPPSVLSPAADPQYVLPGQPVHLTWTGLESAYHLEVLSIDSDIPVISLDIDAGQFDLRLNWLGTFRWRVSGRSGPVESQASGEGLICVVEK